MKPIAWLVLRIWIVLLGAIPLGCGRQQSEAERTPPLVFWHAMSDKKAAVLRDIVRDYNATQPPIPVQEVVVGDYDGLYKKTVSALLAKRPPDLVTAYESMVSEFMRYREMVDFTAFLNESEATDGLRDDIYPSLLDSNRYPAFGGKILSMPFTKSILMFYYNVDMLREVGRDKPPATWEDFIAACRDIKAKRNISPLALARDASTIDGLIYSFGGELYDPRRQVPLFDQPPAVGALRLIRDLFDPGLAHEVAYGTFDDRIDFAQKRAAFFIRSSTSRPYVAEMVKDTFRWNMTVIPRAAAAKQPRTVLFGANIGVFKSTPDRERAAWQFIAYFLSKDVTARWAIETGYLPVRRSAFETPLLKDFLQKHPANARTIEAVPFARSEPSVRGWQEVRSAVEKAAGNVIAKQQTPEQAAQWLQNEAVQILKD